MSTFTTIIQHGSGSPSYSNQRRKIKGIQIRKEEVKLTLFEDDRTLYIENPKDSIRKLLELTKGRLVKAVVFPVVMYGRESWTVKKAEH